jgi:drug/metabolite transporter (DMT)-like permease
LTDYKLTGKLTFGPIFIAILAAALFGAASPAGKFLLNSFTAVQLAGLLYLGAAAGLAVPVWRQGKRANLPWQLSGINLFRLIGAIVFGGIAAPICLLLSLRLASATSISIWLTLESILTAVVAVIFFKEHMSAKSWLSVAGCVGASVILSWGSGTSGLTASLLVALACLFWAVDNNLTALIDGLTPQEIAFWKGSVAGVFNFALGLCLSPFHPSMSPVIWALVVGALSYGASLVLYISAAQMLGAMRSQMIFATAPWWGVALSIVCLGETAGPQQVLAAVVFGGSIVLLLLEQHSHSHSHDELSHIHMHSHDDRHHNHVHDGMQVNQQHSHWHTHEALSHAHPHWPDLHHRHDHSHDHADPSAGDA